jgi:hypothetical protein
MTHGSGIAGYNVQTAVDAEHDLIVEHEERNNGSDRDQLPDMANKARTASALQYWWMYGVYSCLDGFDSRPRLQHLSCPRSGIVQNQNILVAGIYR